MDDGVRFYLVLTKSQPASRSANRPCVDTGDSMGAPEKNGREYARLARQAMTRYNNPVRIEIRRIRGRAEAKK